MWVGAAPPLEWSGDRNCSHAVNSVVDFVRVFGGARLVFVGDSIARNEVMDIVGRAYGCDPPEMDKRSNYTGGDAWRRAWTIDVDAEPGGAAPAFVAARRAACDGLAAGAGWYDRLFTLRLPSNNSRVVALEFRWEPRIASVPRSAWWQAIDAGVADADAVVVGAYAWLAFGQGRGEEEPMPSDEYIVAAHRQFIAVLAASPRAAYWRDRLVHRSPPVMEREAFAGLYSTAGSLRVTNDVGAVWRAAGFRTLNMTGYSRVAACGADAAAAAAVNATPGYGGGHCLATVLTSDGHHMQPWTSGVTFQALVTALAAHACPRTRAPPECRPTCEFNLTARQLQQPGAVLGV